MAGPDVLEIFDGVGVTGAAYAQPLVGGAGVGVNADELVTPASVMKIQVALAVHTVIAEDPAIGRLIRVLRPERRTPGPTGIALAQDDVTMSVRDLVAAMLTISDNVATDELIELVGLDRVNDLTRDLGMRQTVIIDNLRDMLDGIAREVGFEDYPAMAAHDPGRHGPPYNDRIRTLVAHSAALDPERGSRPTAQEVVTLLMSIWIDAAARPTACNAMRDTMGHQLTRNRIAAGFGPDVRVSAKSGGLLGIVRNEAGVVELPDGRAYAVAVFTRCAPDAGVDPAAIDFGIGRVARVLVDHLSVAN